jgi:2-hydroxychromene-2-carboxylate isomerase
LPAGHPFNPLPLLRLALVLGPSIEVVTRLFRYVWVDGRLPQDPVPWAALLTEFEANGIEEPAEVKLRLRQATEAAAASGIFGVPSSVVDGRLFWGYDATDMLLDYCRDPGAFDTPALRRAATVPVAAMRSRPPAGS